MGASVKLSNSAADLAFTELAVLIGRATGANLLDHNDALYAAGCLVVLGKWARVSNEHMAEAIAPFTVEEAKDTFDSA